MTAILFLSDVTVMEQMAASLDLLSRPKPGINLALQGGGAHGAFTWGVLDRLLEEDRFPVDGVSGTSAGAVNAVALAIGLAEGGPEGAREKLAKIWDGVSTRFDALRPGPRKMLEEAGSQGQEDVATHLLMGLISRIYSPYDLDIFDFDPLRDVLVENLDFDRLRDPEVARVIIAATEVSTGKPHYFRNENIDVETVLASACLPTLRKAVQIGEHHYWDGGFSSNPPILPLVRESEAEDTVLVKLDPTQKPDLPTKAQEIAARVSNLAFGQPLRSEIKTIEELRHTSRMGGLFSRPEDRRVIRHRFHMIDAGEHTLMLGHTTKLTPYRELLEDLRDRGRSTAEAWLRDDADSVGDASSLDLTTLTE
ncbi:MAG: patatin-like phospholipase family protein [Magnetospiraceae bacterium]